MDPDRFWEAVEKWMFTKGAIPELLETDYKVTKCEDGGILTMTTYASSGTVVEMFAGKWMGTNHTKYFFHREKDELRGYNYNTDHTLSEKSLSEENVMKVWRYPFRLEFYINELSARLCGPFAKAWVDPILHHCGLHVETFCNVDSPTEPGEKSILTGPINDPDWTFQKFWETYKAVAIRDMGAQEADENFLILEMNNVFFTMYSTICLVKDGTHIVTRNHDDDETLWECKAEFWHKVIDNPPRLEIWMTNMPTRESKGKAKWVAETLLNAILRFARGEEAMKMPELPDEVKKEMQKGIEAWRRQKQWAPAEDDE